MTPAEIQAQRQAGFTEQMRPYRERMQAFQANPGLQDYLASGPGHSIPNELLGHFAAGGTFADLGLHGWEGNERPQAGALANAQRHGVAAQRLPSTFTQRFQAPAAPPPPVPGAVFTGLAQPPPSGLQAPTRKIRTF